MTDIKRKGDITTWPVDLETNLKKREKKTIVNTKKQAERPRDLYLVYNKDKIG